MATIAELATALNGTAYPFRHFAWRKAPVGDYGTYQENFGNENIADNGVTQQTLDVSVHLYTKDDTSVPRVTIQDVFDDLALPYHLESVTYENDTGFVHLEWTVQADG